MFIHTYIYIYIYMLQRNTIYKTLECGFAVLS